jgi:hypothetical protein
LFRINSAHAKNKTQFQTGGEVNPPPYKLRRLFAAKFVALNPAEFRAHLT